MIEFSPGHGPTGNDHIEAPSGGYTLDMLLQTVLIIVQNTKKLRLESHLLERRCEVGRPAPVTRATLPSRLAEGTARTIVVMIEAGLLMCVKLWTKAGAAVKSEVVRSCGAVREKVRELENLEERDRFIEMKIVDGK